MFTNSDYPLSPSYKTANESYKISYAREIVTKMSRCIEIKKLGVVVAVLN
jgi:hypothetical protein